MAVWGAKLHSTAGACTQSSHVPKHLSRLTLHSQGQVSFPLLPLSQHDVALVSHFSNLEKTGKSCVPL